MARLIVEVNTNDDSPILLGDEAQNKAKTAPSPTKNWANAEVADNESNQTDRAHEDDELDRAETLDIEQFSVDPRRLINMSAKERSFVLRGITAKLKRHGQAIAKENKQQQGLAPLSKEQTTHRIEYYQVDHLGTPQELTSVQGEILWQATYAAWGNTVRIETTRPAFGGGNGNDTSPVRPEPVEGSNHGREKRTRLTPHTDIAEQRFKKQTKQEAANEAGFGPRDDQQQNLRFQGQYFDQETGLHYNRFRYYDPDVGRFINQDPVGYIGGNNLFRYALNPTRWVDPLGLSSSDPCDLPCPPGTMDPKDIHFMQNNAKNRSKDGQYTVLDNAESLKRGTLDPNSIPKIRVWQDASGKVWTLDHRRLAAFRLAKKCVPVNRVPKDELDPSEVRRKMTTDNDGKSMELKLEDGTRITID
jgi:RHS repeat-associated protein